VSRRDHGADVMCLIAGRLAGAEDEGGVTTSPRHAGMDDAHVLAQY
jgi:hypothetical protein